jgi:cellulose synthase/poly-beta-1,6-N-acetylglucosamine synthase-like glycosyltransferase
VVATVATMTVDQLEESTDGLRLRAPELSASRVITWAQAAGLGLSLVGTVAAFVVAPLHFAGALVALATAIYAVTLSYRAFLYWRAATGTNVVHVADDEARRIPDHQLPTYCVLVAAYHEAAVIPDLFAALALLDYPWSRMEVKLLLEGDDFETQAVAFALKPDYVDLVIVPAARPRTKPKALNYGLLMTDADLVVIFDVEDRPDPLQLRRAAYALARLGPDVACLQAQLAFRNVDQNILTRWFSLEYRLWFTQFLPGLVGARAPIPLGGTSNHFRRQLLIDIGAWDPYNVTEDADLGVRLYRGGYHTLVLDSITSEEANSDFINWMKQRSRWLKGYLQTWAVHMRHPRELWRQLGARGFVQFNLFVGGTPLLALMNPIFWTMTLTWLIVRPAFVRPLFSGPVYYLSLMTWLVGNFALVYMHLLAAEEMDRPRLRRAALLTPFYWLMMSVAAVKALVQFATTPFHWEKTTHGLDRQGIEGASVFASSAMSLPPPDHRDRVELNG